MILNKLIVIMNLLMHQKKVLLHQLIHSIQDSNKLTMENSDYLYGVTQKSEGVSNIVSVNLADIEKKYMDLIK